MPNYLNNVPAAGDPWTDEELDEYCVARPPGQKPFVPKLNITESQTLESSFIEDIKSAFNSMSTCQKKYEEKIITILKSNPNLVNSSLDQTGTTPLTAAIKNKSIYLCEFLLKSDAIKIKDEESSLALSWFREDCSNEKVKELARTIKQKMNQQKKSFDTSPKTDTEESNGGKKTRKTKRSKQKRKSKRTKSKSKTRRSK